MIEYLNLNLVCVINKKTGHKQYFGVNDRHYDGMLATGGCWELEKDFEWEYHGDVRIGEDFLKEEGLIWKE